MKANIKLEHHLLAVEDEHDVHAMLELTWPPAPAREREPLRLALVIDRSDSMVVMIPLGKLASTEIVQRYTDAVRYSWAEPIAGRLAGTAFAVVPVYHPSFKRRNQDLVESVYSYASARVGQILSGKASS